MASIETEIEVRIYDPSKVREFLRVNYGRNSPDKVVSFTDRYFKKNLLKDGSRFRIREILNDPKSYLATRKSPKMDSSGVQSGEELEKKYGSIREAYDFLEVDPKENPWFEETLRVEKYDFPEFSLDIREVKGLFNYVEIEGKDPSKRGDILEISKKLQSYLGKGSYENLPKGGAFELVCKLRGR